MYPKLAAQSKQHIRTHSRVNKRHSNQNVTSMTSNRSEYRLRVQKMQRSNYGQKHAGVNMGYHVRGGSNQIIRRSGMKYSLKNDYKS